MLERVSEWQVYRGWAGPPSCASVALRRRLPRITPIFGEFGTNSGWSIGLSIGLRPADYCLSVLLFRGYHMGAARMPEDWSDPCYVWVAITCHPNAKTKRPDGCLTLSSLNLPLPSSSTTSRELLLQFSTCSEWKWFDVSEKLKKMTMYW